MSQSTKSLFIALCLLGLKIICGEEVPTPCSAAPTFSDPNTLKRSFRAWPVSYSIRLKCEANGAPPLKYTWLKDGHRMPTRRMDPYLNSSVWYLKLTKLVPKDSGKYTCIVSNPCGSIFHTYTLKVVAKTRTRPILQRDLPRNRTAETGGSAVMKCVVLVSRTKPDLKWLKWDKSVKSLPKLIDNFENGLYKSIDPRYYTTIPVDGNYGVELRIDNVTEDDFGLYTCLVSNFIGKDYNSAFLSRYVKPKLDTVSTHLHVTDPEGVTTHNPGTARTSGIQYLGPLIAVAVVVFIGLILAFTWMYWQLKKARQTSARSRRPDIDSIQPKYEVKNEYVVVPDFK